MNRKEAMEYINKTTWRGSRLGLDRMEKLLKLIGNPEKKLKFIHIAGTNGKGSTAAMLASVLTEAGYKTGLFTSPYIHSFHERIKVNGKNIPEEELTATITYLKRFIESMEDKPTEFELITVIAFLYFQACQCDIVVIEVGLGGRLDSTNVIPTPEAAVITAIDMDHMNELGDTIEKIAYEKAGIIKEYGDVILYQQKESVYEVIRTICHQKSSSLHLVEFKNLEILSSNLEEQKLKFEGFKEVVIRLLGEYQQKNTAVVLKTIEVLRTKGWVISDQALHDGLKKTTWPGRFEVLNRAPCFIVDGAHNPNGVQALVKNMELYFSGKKKLFLVGVLKDKDYSTMIQLIAPYGDQWIVVQPENERALSTVDLTKILKEKYNKDVIEAANVREGVNLALKLAEEEQIIISFGSLYMVGEIREAIYHKQIL